MVSPCCTKAPCCKGKAVKTQDKKDDGEWIEPIRHKSTKQRQVSTGVAEDHDDDETLDSVDPRGDVRPKRLSNPRLSLTPDDFASQGSPSDKKNSTSAKLTRKTSSKISWEELIEDMDKEDEKDPQDGAAVNLDISKSLNKIGNNILLDSLSEPERKLLEGGSSDDEDEESLSENANRRGKKSAEEDGHNRSSTMFGVAFRGSGSSKNLNKGKKHTNKTSRKTVSWGKDEHDEDEKLLDKSAIRRGKKSAEGGSHNSWSNMLGVAFRSPGTSRTKDKSRETNIRVKNSSNNEGEESLNKNAIGKEKKSAKKQDEGKNHTNATFNRSVSWGEESSSSRALRLESAVEKKKRNTESFFAPLKQGTKTSPGNSTSSTDLPTKSKNAITSLAPLGDGYFLTASKLNCIIKMWKPKAGSGVTLKDDKSDDAKSSLNPKVDFVCDFEGHSSSGIMDLKVLDKKGRFLSVGKDSTIRLWDSRYNCINDQAPHYGESSQDQKPITLLATFKPPNGRRVHSIAVLDEGDYVRPTDEIDMAMIKAMAIKTAFEGSNAVHRAAVQREIISCSGTFATASKNDKVVRVWGIDVLDKEERNHGSLIATSSDSRKDAAKSKNVAKITLAHELKNDSSIVAMSSAGDDMILVGDTMGDVFLWQKARSSMVTVHKTWARTRKFTWVTGKQRCSLEEIYKQSISLLSFLEGEDMFVVGTKRGVLSIWEVDNDKEVVSKKESIRMRVRKSSMTGIQKLPSAFDPKTKQSCRAFSTSHEDGFVVSIAMRSQKKGAFKYSPFVFHALDFSNIYVDEFLEDTTTEEANVITSIAALDENVVAGDTHGGIYIFSPTWSSGLGFGDALAPNWKNDVWSNDSFA